jgi:DNA-binding NarL/FixJ family response regulator
LIFNFEAYMQRAPKQRREPSPRRKRPEALTNREQEILQLIWTGLKNREIAQRLKISVKTVEAHRATMMKKVRVSNTAQLLKAAIQDGMIQIR